jgi:hypothetical protein
MGLPAMPACLLVLRRMAFGASGGAWLIKSVCCVSPAADFAARFYGMRGRLWALWTIQTLGGVFCMLLGITPVYSSLTATMIVLVIFSIWCQQACGLSCGVVPFVSKRSTGLVYGMVGAGGNTGAAVTQVRMCWQLRPTSLVLLVTTSGLSNQLGNQLLDLCSAEGGILQTTEPVRQ